MKTISIFNNKGGVGKTTLTFHLAHALAAMGYKTLLIDLDPQCNLTIHGLDQEALHEIWKAEDGFIDDFEREQKLTPSSIFSEILDSVRSIHFLLKPTEDGTAELETLPPPYWLNDNLALIPGRLTMHMYEDKISKLWSEVYQGDPQAIRTVTKIRSIAQSYTDKFKFNLVIMDTSPSLGTLNKVVISNTDGFFIPCMPDMFSLYGIRNIGNALAVWKKQFDTIYHLLSETKRAQFPENFVRLLGFTIYKAKKYTRGKNDLDLAQAHYNYAAKIPGAIQNYISPDVRNSIDGAVLSVPIGEAKIMHDHNTFPSLAQKYRVPMWDVPGCVNLDDDDANTVTGNKNKFRATKENYIAFARDLLNRVAMLD